MRVGVEREVDLVELLRLLERLGRETDGRLVEEGLDTDVERLDFEPVLEEREREGELIPGRELLDRDGRLEVDWDRL